MFVNSVETTRSRRQLLTTIRSKYINLAQKNP